MVVHSLEALEADPHHINLPEFISIHLLIFTIRGHEHHEIVFFFHSKEMKRNIFKIAVQCICVPHCLVGEVSIDLITIDISRTVPLLLDESGSIDALLFISANP